MLVGWAPGMDPLTLQPGNAKLIKKGSVLVFQMHYTSTGVAAKDRTKIGLYFAKTPLEKRMFTRGVTVDPSKLVIPPGEANFESRSSYTFSEDVHLHMFMPHMHVRGKDFEYKLVYPDGKEKVLLRVPKYDFNWQLTYFVKEAIAVPKGSRIECLAHHDNSAGNKFNPDPTITVRWGDQTWEEMMIGWIDYTIDGQNLRAQGQTVMFVAVDGRLAGLLGVADPIKETAPDALRALAGEGLRIVMVTGDGAATAHAVAERLGITEVVAEALPADKVAVVARLQAEGRVVAVAGDGINDAPALAKAQVGIAMGTGTDVAIESAGVTLVEGDLRALVRALRLSRATMRNIRQNLWFAFLYNSLGIPVAAGLLYPSFGILLSPMIASAAMSLSSVSVIGNALRLRRVNL